MKVEEFVVACLKKGVQWSSDQLDRFYRYADLLKSWNEKMNLTAITEFEEVLEKHFYDSLIPFFGMTLEGKLCDVGAGAGFPSIPLKIMAPQLEVTILEPLNKRVTFLKEVASVLQLQHIHIVNQRAEDYARQHREEFDLVTARAVAALPVLAELCLPLVRQDGLFVAMKGAAGHQEKTQAQKAIDTLGARLEDVQQVSLSDGSQRINLMYRKIRKTPPQYPRPYARIKKNPL